MNDEIPPRKQGPLADFLASLGVWAAVVTGAVGLITGVGLIADGRSVGGGGACLTAAAVAFGLVANALLRK